MNAIKFIKEHGVEKAREVVEGAPEWAFGYDFIDDDYFTGADIQDGYSIDQCDGCVCICDLKRLVESVDIITKVGGIREAIEEHAKWMHAPELHLYRIGESVERLKQAIADYEAIYCVADMGDDSHIENHVSPNCKVGVK